MLTLDKVYQAAHILKKTAKVTEVIEAPKINPESYVYLKTENLQVTGSFKLRGAYYKISTLSEEEKQRGVIACSAGNHAQGVALAAKESGIPAVICLPESAPISKIEATKSYGAKVVLVKGVYDDAYEEALRLQKEHGYVFIHPYDDEKVIAGQGTIGIELLNQIPDLDAVVVPIGGGGLISGIAFAIKQLNPKCKVYGVQAVGAPSMYNAHKEHKISTIPSVFTIADGIAVKTPGKLTFECVEKYVDDIVTVTDDEISSAILALIEQQKLIAEGAGAASVAAVMFNKVDVKDKKVACVLSGGNIDVTILSKVISRGLQKSGRSADLTIELQDRPGELRGVSEIVADMGANVTSVHHDRTDVDGAVSGCYLKLRMDTRDHEHVQQIREALKVHEFKVID